MQVSPRLWPAPDADWRLPTELIETIQQTLIQPAPTDLSKMQRHDLAQKRVAQLGCNLGYEARIEVGTGYRAKIRQGRFDVVWFAPEMKKSIVFEIDSCWRRESIVKLSRVRDSELRLWIYYGNRSIPEDPVQPGLRKLNILRIHPEQLGLRRPSLLDRRGDGSWPVELTPPVRIASPGPACFAW